MSKDNQSEKERWEDWAANTTDIAEAFAAPNIRSEQRSEADTSTTCEQEQDNSAQNQYPGRPYPW